MSVEEQKPEMAKIPYLTYMPQKVVDYENSLKPKNIEIQNNSQTITVVQIPMVDNSSKVLIKKEDKKDDGINRPTKAERKDFVSRVREGRKPIQTEKPSELIQQPRKLLSKNDVNRVIERLQQKVDDSLTWCRRIQTPPISTNVKENRKIKIENQNFLTSGVYWFGIEIIEIIRGLIRYANYNPDLFGEQNTKLGFTLEGIDTLYPQFKNKTVKGEEAILSLLRLVGITEIILSSAPVLVKQKIMEPSIESTKVRV